MYARGSFCSWNVDMSNMYSSSQRVSHSQRCSEGCMFLIFWIHLDLIISWEAVHEGHSPKYASIVNHDIRNWERKPVFGTSNIQIVKVNIDPDLLIFLWDRHDISYPLRLLFFPNEKESYEILDFRFNCLYNLWMQSSLLLFDWFGIQINVKAMHGYLWVGISS